MLRKPLEEIFDIQISGIHFDSSEIIHPSSFFQVYSDCRFLEVLCVLKKKTKPNQKLLPRNPSLDLREGKESENKVLPATSQEAFCISSKSELDHAHKEI